MVRHRQLLRGTSLRASLLCNPEHRLQAAYQSSHRNSDAGLKTIYQDYREMQDSSEAARYEVNGVKFDDLAHAAACLARVKSAIREADPRVIGELTEGT
jgi:hypothetical protein